ncbi:fungal-specific transcription factor domain-containing protein [Talaromyces proteolyticus]|uniref:Fungal-specific transcription factor domain-containing protein n=1 Tax=Talaromyces proteolyticus TaxID=1131652 RepID=A0AAD4KFG4_9EURO|nr:fungal-specific transcription factor domain-containing protein [Talaromyces proteolyticus]KAH8691123.1 fungal-specific transcription factor domain-containing protein [Talaromyces proteolyticus]
MFRFVPYQSNSQQDGRNFQRACTTCRNRKKRCYHDNPSDAPHAENSSLTSQQEPARKRARYPSNTLPDQSDREVSRTSNEMEPLLATGSSAHTRNDDEHPEDDDNDGEARFVGHLNPESTFLAATNQIPVSVKTDDIGVWTHDGTAEETRRNIMPATPKFELRDKNGYIRWEDLLYLPRESDFKVLYNLYLEEIHPVFPVIDQQIFENLPTNIAECTFLRLAICIAGSVSPKAKTHLKSSPERSHYSSRDDFIKELTFSLRLLLNLNVVRDKIVLVQGLSLAAMFTQLSENRDLSAELAASAVGYVHTTGLHLESQGKGNDNSESQSEARARLFCCVWALDKLNAAFHGRPVMMHERDIGRNIESSISMQQPSFQLLLRIVVLLDQVIGLYRPSNESKMSLEGDFPLFEDLIEKSNAVNINSRFLATVETLYHSVAMLSYRSKSFHEPPTSSATFLRQNLSALKVTSLVSEGLNMSSHYNLPFVPYAISLSLRVTYRELRISRSSMLRERAKKQLLANSEILHRFESIFGSLSALAIMAELIVREMERRTIQQQQQTTDPTQLRRQQQQHDNVLPIASLLSAANEIPPVQLDGSSGQNLYQPAPQPSSTQYDEPIPSERMPGSEFTSGADLDNIDLSMYDLSMFDSLFNLDITNFQVLEG